MGKIQLSIHEMLVWYDTPQLFTAADGEGNWYVCLVYDVTESGELLATGSRVSLEEMGLFLEGWRDLGDLIRMADAGGKVFDLVVDGGITAERRTEPVEGRMLPSGEYYHRHKKTGI